MPCNTRVSCRCVRCGPASNYKIYTQTESIDMEKWQDSWSAIVNEPWYFQGLPVRSPYYGDWVWYGVEIMDPHWHLNFPLNPKKCHAIHKNHLWTPRVSSFFRFHVQSWGCDIHKSWRTTIGIDPAEMGTRLITKLSFRKDAKCHNPRYSG